MTCQCGQCGWPQYHKPCDPEYKAPTDDERSLLDLPEHSQDCGHCNATGQLYSPDLEHHIPCPYCSQ